MTIALKRRNVLCVAHSSYEVYLLAGIVHLVRNLDPDTRFDLWAPASVLDRQAAEVSREFDTVVSVVLPSISLQPKSDLKSISAFGRLLGGMPAAPDVILSAAYRSTATNMLARKFGTVSRIVALRQGGRENPDAYPRKRTLFQAYHNAFNAFIGASPMDFRWAADTDLMGYVRFRRDPIDTLIVLSLAADPEPGSKTVKLPPALAALKKNYRPSCIRPSGDRPALLLIGERTPLFASWSAEEETRYVDAVTRIRQAFEGWRLYFKPRPGLTDAGALDLRGFEIVPAEASLEDLLLRGSFDLVLSAKSTASKLAYFLGMPSGLLYPMFGLSAEIAGPLDDFFSDVPDLPRVAALDQIERGFFIGSRIQIEDTAPAYYEALFGSRPPA